MKIIAITIVILLPFLAQAGSKAQGSGPNIYTECGIGGMLFSESTTGSNVGAVISNVIWDAGITATTSALSSPQLCVDKKETVARVILETLPELEKDIAAGEGKYLTALSEVASCDANAVNANLRTSYSDVVSREDYASMAKTDKAAIIYNVVDSSCVL